MSVREITDYVQWNKFIEESPQGTIFSTTKWMNLWDEPFKIYGYFKNDSLLGGIIGRAYETDFTSGFELTPFQGILVIPMPDAKYTSVMAMHNEVANKLINALEERYLFISISNHCTFPDIRPFLWKGYEPSVRYTYVVDLADMGDRLEKDTRYLIKHSDRVLVEPDLAVFDKLYENTFERRGLIRPVSTEFIKRLYSELDSSLYMADNAGVLMIRDKKRSYYILGASTGDGSSSVLWQALSSESSSECDLVGCNDKNIGLFKRGFGGILTPYYCVSNL